MNDIEKRIEEQNESLIKELHLFADRVKRADVDGKFDLVDDLATSVSQRFSTLYHQLLSEERQRLIGVVERTPKRSSDPIVPSQFSDGWEACRDYLLTTLNKEKD